MKENQIVEQIMIGTLVILLVVTAAVIVGSITDSTYSTCSNTTSNSSSASVYTSATTLSPVGEGITSSEVKAYNNSWMYFDKVNDYIFNTDFFDGYNESFSVSFWFYYVNGSGNPVILGKGNNCGSASNNAGWGFKIYNNDISFEACRGGQQYNYSIARLSTNVTQREWSHFVGVYDAISDNLTIYDDLTNLTQPSNNLIVNSTGTFYINGMSGNYVEGAFDEVRIYNKTLTDAQITEIYNSGRIANSSLPSDGLVLWYSFDEQTGTTVYDKSGNGNNGN